MNYWEIFKPIFSVNEAIGPLDSLDRISSDSRSIKSGDIFLPFVGENFDGHKFIDDVLEKGAAGFFCNRSDIHENHEKAIRVEDTLKTYQTMASLWLKHVEPKNVIAVTGSVGKTTCKEFLKAIFKTSHVTQGNYNNDIGVPKTILQMPIDTETLILEMGARHVGDIKRLVDIANPNIGCCLCVKEVHLSEFGSLDNIYRGKSEIFHSPINVCFRDDERLFELVKSDRVISFGDHNSSDVKICDYEIFESHKMDIKLSHKGIETTFSLNHAHDSYPHNLSAAVSIGIACGLTMNTMKELVSNFAPQRFISKTLPTGQVLIDDCYNASPASMISSLSTLQSLYPNHSCALVIGDMFELGNLSESEHKKLGFYIRDQIRPDLLICVGERSKHISDIVSGSLWFDSVEKLNLEIDDINLIQDIIFVKASNGIHLSLFVEKLS